jgi:hypothetical protein
VHGEAAGAEGGTSGDVEGGEERSGKGEEGWRREETHLNSLLRERCGFDLIPGEVAEHLAQDALGRMIRYYIHKCEGRDMMQ